MKVYRGLHEDYDENFVRDFEEYHYCNCYSFWTPNKNYAKKFGEKIMSRDIDPKKFFDLEKDDPDDFAFLTGESIEPAEQNLEFAIFLTLNESFNLLSKLSEVSELRSIKRCFREL